MRQRFLLIFRAFRVFHRQGFGPILPVFVANDDADRRPDSLRVAHARHDFGGIGLDLHAPSAAVPLLAAPKLAVDGVDGNRHSGGQSGQRRYKALAVGLARGLESQHAENLC
jgi:hypothetical protein